MAETNGRNGWIMYLVGVLVTLVLIVGIPMIVSAIAENDKSSRERDITLERTLSFKLDTLIKENNAAHGEILKILYNK